MFMYVWGYGIMEMDGDGQQEEVGEKSIQIVQCKLRSLMLMKDT